jgi:hypothetical protein
MHKPILHFSDAQLTEIFRLAAPLAPAQRVAFLEDVANALDGQDPGDGALYRVCRELQRKHFDPPNLGGPGVSAKWGRR